MAGTVAAYGDTPGGVGAYARCGTCGGSGCSAGGAVDGALGSGVGSRGDGWSCGVGACGPCESVGRGNARIAGCCGVSVRGGTGGSVWRTCARGAGWFCGA